MPRCFVRCLLTDGVSTWHWYFSDEIYEPVIILTDIYPRNFREKRVFSRKKNYRNLGGSCYLSRNLSSSWILKISHKPVSKVNVSIETINWEIKGYRHTAFSFLSRSQCIKNIRKFALTTGRSDLHILLITAAYSCAQIISHCHQSDTIGALRSRLPKITIPPPSTSWLHNRKS